MNRKPNRKSITALLLSVLLLFQTSTAFATAGTVSGSQSREEAGDVAVSGNQPAGEEGIPTVSENEPDGREESEAEAEVEENPDDMEESAPEEEEDTIEGTVSGQSIPEFQAGAVTGPANPVHHCTKKNDGSDYTDFSYVYFGSYPQSEVTDSATIAAIDKEIAASGAAAEAGTDVWVNGTKYRRISKSDTNYSGYFNKVSNNGYRYFKWERIKWRVLENDGKTLFVVADWVIDCKNYNETRTSITWETSTIRNWLNSSFYQTAFSGLEQSAVVAQTVVNENNPVYGTAGGNSTNDKVYLLSIGEVTNEGYGFCSDYSVYSMSRRMKASDYANARGTYRSSTDSYRDNCWWWLRSPGSLHWLSHTEGR